jgi:hypothetical protein
LRKWVTGTSFLVTQPYLSYRCWLFRAQAVSAAPAASFKPTLLPSDEIRVCRDSCFNEVFAGRLLAIVCSWKDFFNAAWGASV